ncbi:MAG: hypothetical protein HZA46_16625 [Planctomycetales bacterium]|nr:hypothetical protein [Planctomycetales bacterium]
MNDASPRSPVRGPPLVIYPSRWKATLVVLGAAIFVAIGVAMIVVPDDPGLARWFLRRLGLVSVLFFGACGAYALFRLVVPRPALVADADGLVDNASAVGVGRLRWDEIECLWPYEFSGQNFLGIMPVNLEDVLARLPGWKNALIRANLSFACAPINIPQVMLPVRLDDVVTELVERFGVPVRFLATEREEEEYDSESEIKGDDDRTQPPNDNATT